MKCYWLYLQDIYRSLHTYLHCYHPGPSCHHFSPGYCICLLLVCSLLSFFYFEIISNPQVIPLLKTLLSRLSQNKNKGWGWPRRPYVIWLLVTFLSTLLLIFPWSVCSRAWPLDIPGAWLSLSCFRTLFVLFVLPSIFLLQLAVWLSVLPPLALCSNTTFSTRP